MPTWESFVEQFGPWFAIVLYIIVKDAIPFLTGKYLPSKIKEAEDIRADKQADADWRKRMEEERLAELKEIATSTRTLTVSMAQTGERIATIMTNQQRIITNQSEHHNMMMEAVSDMREEVAERRGESRKPRPSATASPLAGV